ncbi:DUF4395 domain-containing protein [Cryobacterium flavum]|uniref:DUF4395 domain-containing protein n=1 Tax=Cryobacterium flavum TaxID=1424659 RepID=A0ABY2I1B3_9MICO|nr:DUF4395 domain-containing protein [Cryobacterium flavum]TFB73808.1 DUF4395 domain-containing protein [Cryobacterium flavum]
MRALTIIARSTNDSLAQNSVREFVQSSNFDHHRTKRPGVRPSSRPRSFPRRTFRDALTGNFAPLRAFAFLFLVDMMLRLFVSARYTPSLLLGGLVVRRQHPEWVGADQKKLAWQLGLGMAFTSCMVMGFFGVSGTVTLMLCGICLSILFLETAFGICVGCSLYRIFATKKPELCPGDTCNYVPPTRADKLRQALTAQLNLPDDSTPPAQPSR